MLYGLKITSNRLKTFFVVLGCLHRRNLVIDKVVSAANFLDSRIFDGDILSFGLLAFIVLA